MDITSYMLGKSTGGGGGGASYSAGTNIEITNENVINNTIPFEATTNGLKLGANTTASSSSVAVGKQAMASEANTIAIGKGTQALYQQSIALGNGAKTNSRYQLKVGGTDCAIDKVTLYTQNGEKDLATKEYVDSQAGGGSEYIEYDSTKASFVVGKLGNNAQKGYNSTFVGSNSFRGAGGFYTCSIGEDSGASGNYSTAFGYNSYAGYNNSIAFGGGASTTKANQLMIGSTDCPINEIAVYTSAGLQHAIIAENISGYDTSKTQVLKNVNGALTWVDE